MPPNNRLHPTGATRLQPRLVVVHNLDVIESWFRWTTRQRVKRGVGQI
jgi:hypothetical protein